MPRYTRFSALQRAEIAEIRRCRCRNLVDRRVSVLFNEPKLLKCGAVDPRRRFVQRFSALQRAEIAEIRLTTGVVDADLDGFSALQRAEIAEIVSR